MFEVSAGSVEAFGELYDRYCTQAYSIARWICRDDGQAEDAVQEAFLSIWRSSASYRAQQGTVAAWLLTVVRYRAIDLTRRSRQQDALRASTDALIDRASAEDVCEKAIAHDEADRLKASLAQLPETQREVIALAFYGQLSHSEIAEQLGLPAGTVKGRMRLGMYKLRASVQRAAV